MKKDYSDFRAGIITDILATDIPDNAFTDGINIRFNSGGVEKIKGDDNALNVGPGLVAYYALSHRSAGIDPMVFLRAKQHHDLKRHQ